jgi:hypothetical protein
MMKAGTRVRVIEPVDQNYGRTGEITVISIETQTCIVRFDDGDELGFLLDDNELEAIS